MASPAIAPTVLGGAIAAAAGILLQTITHLFLVRRESLRLNADLAEAQRAEARRYEEHVVQQRLAAYEALAAWVLVERSRQWGRLTSGGPQDGPRVALPADTFARVHVHGSPPVRSALDLVVKRMSNAAMAAEEFREGGSAGKANAERNALEVEVDNLMALLPAEVQFAEPGTPAEIPGQTRAWPRAK